MNRRQFAKRVAASSVALPILGSASIANASDQSSKYANGQFIEPSKKLPIQEFDVVVAGGGTAGVFAAVAAARNGAKTALIEGKGYTGGIAVEGGTALHSFYNLWQPYDVEKRQVIQGIPQEFIEKLYSMGGCSGHCDNVLKSDYDSVCTAIDTELYKLASMQFLRDSGVEMYLNSFVRGAVTKDGRIEGAIVESRSGRELFKAKTFIDTTGYGDLADYAGASFVELNDYPVNNSMGLGNVDVEKYYKYLKETDSLTDLAYGRRSGKDDQIIRLSGQKKNFPKEFVEEVKGMHISTTTTTVHDNYLMFIKVGIRLPQSPTDRNSVTEAELIIREQMYKYVNAIRKHIPGLENAFIARTAPSLHIRRGRTIECEYDLAPNEIFTAKHFEDEVFNYGFHDAAPNCQVGKGETYGMPYRCLIPKKVENLFVAGQMITTKKSAHMSTRNTVSCMAQGQAVGTAAALASKRSIGVRDIKYSELKDALISGRVYFEG